MSAKLPPQVAETDLNWKIADAGLERISQGKVRDTYRLSDFLLMIATDRLSIFDIVLPRLVPDKGKILNAMDIWWRRELNSVKHHLVAYGAGIDHFLPEQLRGNPELQSRAVVVKKLNLIPVECVVRGYLTGSGWRDYKASGEVCGHKLPSGLHDGARLPHPVFTPATKALSGHDENISAERVNTEYGHQFQNWSLGIYSYGLGVAETRGIIIADTKFEFSRDRTLADEVLTPDSSRFWDIEEWEAAVAWGKSPSGYDKEPVRQWGKIVATPFGVTFDQLDPENPEHLGWVAGKLQVPDEVIFATQDRYQVIFERLTGQQLEEFQQRELEIAV